MITTADVISAYPEAADADPAALEKWTKAANIVLFDDRIKEPRTADVTRIRFVMHHLERPAIDLAAAHVRAQMTVGLRSNLPAPHPWAGTPHGEFVISATKY